MRTNISSRLRVILRTEVLVTVACIAAAAAFFGPQLTSAASYRRQTVLADQLRYIRTQIMVYRAHHDGVAPGYPDGDITMAPTAGAFVAQMTRYTDVRGRTSETQHGSYLFGPYLQNIPANPLSGSADIWIICGDESFPAVSGGTGRWLYQPTTCTFAADLDGQDASGVPLLAY